MPVDLLVNTHFNVNSYDGSRAAYLHYYLVLGLRGSVDQGRDVLDGLKTHEPFWDVSPLFTDFADLKDLLSVNEVVRREIVRAEILVHLREVLHAFHWSSSVLVQATFIKREEADKFTPESQRIVRHFTVTLPDNHLFWQKG